MSTIQGQETFTISQKSLLSREDNGAGVFSLCSTFRIAFSIDTVIRGSTHILALHAPQLLESRLNFESEASTCGGSRPQIHKGDHIHDYLFGVESESNKIKQAQEAFGNSEPRIPSSIQDVVRHVS